MNGARPQVLVVDDEPMVREVLATYLAEAGFAVTVAEDGESAVRAFAADPADLVVLDLMLPGIAGLEVLRRLRIVRRVPVILLTAKGDERDRVLGLDLGADDYVVKPFSPREMAARVRAVLRRSADGSEPLLLEHGPLVVDTGRRVAQLEGVEVELTPREFDLLAYLVRHPGRTCSRTELLTEVWGSSPDWQDPATVTVHIRRLRRKLEPEPDRPRWLQTAYGVGYRFEP